MIKQPESRTDRSDIIREALYNITSIQRTRIDNARSQEQVDAANRFALQARAELQLYFTRSIDELRELADKYKVE